MNTQLQNNLTANSESKSAAQASCKTMCVEEQIQEDWMTFLVASIANRLYVYDAVEIHGVSNIHDCEDKNGALYVIDDESPEYYSVYLHYVCGKDYLAIFKDPGIDSIASFSTFEKAKHFAKEISEMYGFKIYNFCVNKEVI